MVRFRLRRSAIPCLGFLCASVTQSTPRPHLHQLSLPRFDVLSVQSIPCIKFLYTEKVTRSKSSELLNHHIIEFIILPPHSNNFESIFSFIIPPNILHWFQRGPPTHLLE